MSGSIISTGILTNKGANQLDIEQIMDQIIKDITIQIIPLSSDNNVKFTRKLGDYFNLFYILFSRQHFVIWLSN